MTPPEPKPRLNLGLRRLIACIAILIFLIVYIYAVTAIGIWIGDRGAITYVFYAIAGLLWGVPILPIISWSEAYKRKR
jgi:hypothetical protein